MNTLRIKSTPLILLACLGGCAAGPEIKQSAASTTQAAQTAPAVRAEVQKPVSVQDVASDWNALFQSSYLDALIRRAVAANPNAEAAQAALSRLQANPVARQGFFYSAGLSVPDIQAEKQAAVPDYFSLHCVQLTVGYVPEVLGAKQKIPDPAKFQSAMRREASYFTLASNAVAAAIQKASLRAQIEAQLNIVGLNRQSLEIAHNQFKLGYVSEEDVTQQELAAARAQQALAPLQQQLAQVNDLLREMAGNEPDEEAAEQFTLDAIHLSKVLPPSLLSSLVAQRPDVRVAEARLYAASAQYAVPVVASLPRFAVTGATGGKGGSPQWMLKNGGPFFNLKGNIAQVLFDAKTLRAKSKTVQQALNQAGVQYRSVVMAALQDMADTLNVAALDERALKAAAKEALAATNAGEQARRQYETGSVDFQSLLVAQQNEQLAIIHLVRAQTNRAGDAVALFQTLSGRWWKREAAESDKARHP